MSSVRLMNRFLVPFDAPDAVTSDCVGPKAANLAALAYAGLPTPGGFCLTADAYRWQLRHLGIDDVARAYADAAPPQQRRLSVEIRLKLYQAPIADEILTPLL